MRQFTVSKRGMIGFIGLVSFRILLDYIYFNIISVFYAYAGFTDNRSFISGLISWLVFLGGYLMIRSILYSDREGTSHIIISLLYILSFIPFTTIIFAGLTPTAFVIWNSVYWFILIALSKYINRLPKSPLPDLKLDYITINDRFVTIVGVVSLLIVLYISGRYAHFRLNFNFDIIYDLRLEAREFGMSTIETYLFSWTTSINTVMLAYCLIKKKSLLAVFYFAIQMLSFGIDGAKTTFFLPFLVVIVVKLCGNTTIDKLKMFFLYGNVGLSLLAAAEYIVRGTFNIAALFIRRILFVPNILSVHYFDFFTTHEPDFFRGSFLRHFGFVSPYAGDGGIARMIGRVYYGAPAMNCNNGLLSDAVSNLEYVGVFVMPIIIVFFLHLFDRSVQGLDRLLVLVSCIFIALGLISSAFMTVLVTRGFLLLIILTWMMKPEEICVSEKT